MTHERKPQGRAIPESRLARLGRLGALGSGVIGGMAAEGVRRAAHGERPRLNKMLLTPANAVRVADRLAQMRGAAMKVGQMVSMEAGDILPPEWATVLARLRDQADFMPPQQLKTVLTAEWGTDFLKRFHRFDTRPIAAASIGQVHRAIAKDGRELAIKVQYPGVARSIDSDVDNVATLIRMSGLTPKGLNLRPLMEEAKRQLHEEADYQREGAYLARYAGLIANDDNFIVPAKHDDLSTQRILAMTYTPGAPIEAMVDAGQRTRDHIAHVLIDLTLRELFDFRLMQTDPNFANYRYDADAQKVVLLDFGATRDVAPEVSNGYRAILSAGMANDRESVARASSELGFIPNDAPAAMRERMLDIAELVFAPLRAMGPFDFSDTGLAERLRREGQALAQSHQITEIPRVETLFIQRKLGGVYLLAHRLRARVDVNAMLMRYA